LILLLFPCGICGAATQDKSPAFDAVYVITCGPSVYAYDKAFQQISTVRLPGFGETYHVCDADIVPERDLLVLATSTRETPLMALRIPSLESEPGLKFPFRRPVAQYMPLYVKCLTPRYLLLRDETFFSPNEPEPYDTVIADMEKGTIAPTSFGPGGKDAVQTCASGACVIFIGCNALRVVSLESGNILRSIEYPDRGSFEGCVILADSTAGRLGLQGRWRSTSTAASQRCLDIDVSEATVSVSSPKTAVPAIAATAIPRRDAVMRAWARGQRREGDTKWVLADRHMMTALDKFAAALPKDKESAIGNKLFVSPDDRYMFATGFDSGRKIWTLSILATDTAELLQAFSYDHAVLCVLFD